MNGGRRRRRRLGPSAPLLVAPRADPREHIRGLLGGVEIVESDLVPPDEWWLIAGQAVVARGTL